MAHYKSSIDALQQLLQLGTPEGKISDKINSNFVHCQITKASKNISYAKNGSIVMGVSKNQYQY